VDAKVKWMKTIFVISMFKFRFKRRLARRR